MRRSIAPLLTLALAAAGCDAGEPDPSTDTTSTSTSTTTDPATSTSTSTATDDSTSTDTVGALPCPALEVDKALALGGTTHEDVTFSETWTAAASPHRVTRSLQIMGNQTLTIEPCAVVVMTDGTWIEVGSGIIRGGLVAAGTAEAPIVIQGATEGQGTWDGISVYAAEEGSRLSYVMISGGGRDLGSNQAVLRLATPQARMQVDNTTLTNSGAHGLALVYGAQLTSGSTGNVITGNVGSPIFTDFGSLGTLVDGAYTGNGVDEVRVEGGMSDVSVDTTMHRLSVPWHLSDAIVPVTAKLTIEPGNTLIFATTETKSPSFEVSDGGSLVADGGSAEGLITLKGETGAPVPSWGGLTFLHTAHTSVLRHVAISGAGRQEAGIAYGACVADSVPAIHAAVSISRQESQQTASVTVEHVAFDAVGAGNFAISRDYCGGTASDFTGNSYTGPMACGMTDTLPCGNPECDDQFECCTHDYACEAEPTNAG